jgi:hypothetical protein
MTPIEAHRILSDATAQLQMKRADHIVTMQALDVLAGAAGLATPRQTVQVPLSAVPAPEPKAAE